MSGTSPECKLRGQCEQLMGRSAELWCRVHDYFRPGLWGVTQHTAYERHLPKHALRGTAHQSRTTTSHVFLTWVTAYCSWSSLKGKFPNTDYKLEFHLNSLFFVVSNVSLFLETEYAIRKKNKNKFAQMRWWKLIGVLKLNISVVCQWKKIRTL